jgi:hypothetical protein
MKSLIFSLSLVFCMLNVVLAQSVDSTKQIIVTDSTKKVAHADSVQDIDLVYYLAKFLKVKNATEIRDNKKIHFTLFPTSSNSGKTSFTSFNASFLLGGNATNTNISTIYFYPYIGFGGQYGFDVQSYIWMPRNSWNFIGEYFFHNYPQDTWGLGGDSPDDNATLIDYKQLRISQKSMKGIWQNFSMGLGYALDYHYDISVDEADWDSTNRYLPYDEISSTSSGILLPLLYDSRRNSINPKQGFMAGLTFRINTPYLGSDDKWQSLFLDVRKYIPLFKSGYKPHILVFRSYYWTILSGIVPYLDIPAVRWEPAPGQSSRGIQQNRYKSNAILDFETEYRFGITSNGFIGGVVFGSLTSASQYNTQQFVYWHPAGGMGIRMKFNKYSDTNIAFDIAVSKGFLNVYLFIGEAY